MSKRPVDILLVNKATNGVDVNCIVRHSVRSVGAAVLMTRYNT